MRIPTPLAQVVRGFSMGTADIVPGVSGGTVALVLGIYDELIHNISTGAHGLKQLLTGDVAGLRATLRSIEWIWLFSLLAGVLTAVFALSSLLERLLEDEPIKMSALFLGLVAGAIWVALRMIDKIDGTSIAIMVGIAIVFFLLLGLRSDTHAADDAAEVVTRAWWVFFVAGAIAICAMILPGISGSFLLVMLGMYTEIIGAVSDRNIFVLVVFALGCVVGLGLFSTLLNWLLANYHRWVLSAMVGLMLGSTRVLWPWPNGTNTTTLSLPSNDVFVPVLLIVVGAAVVVAVDLVATKFVKVESLPEHERSVESTT